VASARVKESAGLATVGFGKGKMHAKEGRMKERDGLFDGGGSAQNGGGSGI